jgi:hypothetical protein
MAYTVPEEIQNETNCDQQFSCLKQEKNGGREICDISDADGLNVLFIKSNEYSECSHRLSFGFSEVCSCPTRYAIYKKYLK